MGTFAARLGIEAERYRRYERDETEPDIETLAKIRRITGVSLDHLVAGDPDLILSVSHPHTYKSKKVV